jgi:glycosyltransferase involved in cell wall biosynthesis
VKSKFIILDQSLSDYGGHYYNLDIAVALGAASMGLEPLVFAHRELLATLDTRGVPVIPWFLRPFWQFAREDPADDASFSSLIHRAVASAGATRADHVFFPTVGGKDMEDILNAMRRLPAGAQPAWHIMLHFGPDAQPMRTLLQRDLSGVMEEIAATGAGSSGATFYATTPGIARLYRDVTRVPVEPACMPVDLVPAPTAEDGPTPTPLHVVMLGSARPVKGYAIAPDLVAQLYDPHVRDGRLRFTFHAVRRRSDPIESLQALEIYPRHHVRLIRDILTSREYFELLASADVVLLPYTEFYRTSASSVLTEALVAGKPVIVSKDMLQADAIDARQGCLISDPREAPNALLHMAAHYPRYRDAARAAAALWRRRHSSAALLQVMLGAHGRR